MTALGPHAAFIIGSYIATAAIIGVLVGMILTDSRARKRELAALDERRSGDPS